MAQVTRQETRILYLLAKHGVSRKTTLSQATARWAGADRDRVIEALVTRELVVKQRTPGGQGQRPGHYFWLTPSGIDIVTELVSAGIVSLPEDWRESHATEERAQLSAR